MSTLSKETTMYRDVRYIEMFAMSRFALDGDFLKILRRYRKCLMVYRDIKYDGNEDRKI